MSKSLFCFGYGYCCDYLGHELQSRGNWKIAGTTRDPEKKEILRQRGIRAQIFDYETPLCDPEMLLEQVTHILISTPPSDEGDPTYLVHGEDLRRLPNLQWVGYLSTTGVYGDRNGGRVDETSEIRPTSKRGSRRALAESQWTEELYQHGLPLHIFRLAGIYGPGRSALDSVRAGTARRISKPGHAFNRIHVEDIVNVLIRSMSAPAPGEIYNLCDDEAAPSHEVISHACALLGQREPPLIPYEQADLSPMARSFYSDNKRINNEKVKRALKVSLKYPTHREGLQACLDAETYALNRMNAAEEKA